MRAMRILLILMILLSARPGHGALSDPGELVENSKVIQVEGVPPAASSTGTLEKATPWNKVTGKVKNWWSQGVNQVQKWTGQEKKSATAKVAPATKTPETPAAPSEATMGQQPIATEAPTEPTAAQVEALKATMPTPGADRPVRAEDLREVRRRLRQEGVASVSNPGRKPQAGLKLSKAGVPLFPMGVQQVVKMKNGKTKVVMAPMKKIPRLDVGQEPTVSRNDFILKDYRMPLTDVANIPALPSPTPINDGLVKNASTQMVIAAEPAKDLEKQNFGIDKIVTKESIAKAMPELKPVAPVQEKPYKELSQAQLAMLTALILYAKGDRCHVLLGLFDEIAKNERFAPEANFFLGQCAARMNMHSLAFERLSGLIRTENPQFVGDAILTLVKALPSDYEIPFSKLIRNLKDKKSIPESVQNEVNFITAKGAFKEGVFQEARGFADKVQEGSPDYGNAQFISALTWYSLGNTAKAIGRLESLRTWMTTKAVVDKNLSSLTAINIARMRFTQGRYKDALAMYMAIEKDHPVWVQGLIEQGWIQLALEDFSGAIGNMYSLHSPYFKTVYKPQSFVVRTIGYLNICQYGDAYRTLSWLENEYRPWADAIAGYVQKKKMASDYYQTTVDYLRGKSDANVEGLPYQVIREMARQREFLNHQTALNKKADEFSRYDGIEKTIAEEKTKLKSRIQKATQRFKELKAKIDRAEKERMVAAQVEPMRAQMRRERELVLGLRYQVDTLEESRRTFADLKPRIISRLEKERYNLREQAGQNLVENLLRLKNEMTMVLANNEFLRYEVFAGSGENIRYQVAGGEVGDANRIPASIKPAKMMNWSFDGEYWEDEIGSYRSSLKNNCPQVGKMTEFFKEQQQATEAQEKGQAAVEKGVGR